MNYKQEIKNLLSYLTEEHKVLLKEAVNIQKDISLNLDLKKIKDFLKKVNEHARLEEVDLDKLIEKANISEFDIEALNFGHRTLEEIEEYLKFLIESYEKGKRTYRGKNLKNEIVKTFNEYIATLKDHFNEEEFYFFPDILKLSYVDEI